MQKRADIVQLKERLKDISDALLVPGDFHPALALAINEYASILFELTNINSESNEQRKDIFTHTGKAIGPFWAAACVREVLRTQRFCRGIYEAVKDCLVKQTTKPIQVIYAGTGPLAALAIPTMMQFRPDQVQFTLLEINPVSYKKLQQLLTILDLNVYVKEFVLADAATWKVTDTADIVVSETMNGGLRNEPQIAIMLNLASQLPGNTILIPEEITVALAALRKENEPLFLKELGRFNKESYREIIAGSSADEWFFQEVVYEPDQEIVSKLVLTTNITVYKSNKLNYNDCSLTLPYSVKGDFSQAKTLRFAYKLGEQTGFNVYAG
ncbi:phytanoyl-CoA dioxygenase (PhyH) family [Pseudopedobacter saltans DSM 12145]|uniref:Phytanoyl-CoA dioxygenase (PhyH) family n=1 Tax=Pseudopedobacter saltans (strain ATCC 51119 / DSM 12145 / JCM 21818 / CCUG 39354 / LMG 10337 / NBRC 100064 / NCIMB 13643) TaxID=762903 RepID=F0SE39_PSESL|nr:phytanoyl-CoA dioxygenase (PhyH) family protein [Pseudopedobacter saltans]ADY52965.1 phytanoyl-CoA dioxygenase (PhyH) family [Pseudopedobacter saltans DSM 12145]